MPPVSMVTVPVFSKRSAAPRSRVPALIVVPPAKVVLALRVSVPVPSLTKAPVPETTESIVVSAASPEVMMPLLTIVPLL